MARNPDFVANVGAALAEAGVDRDDPVFFLCRSGARSAAAAAALTAAGYRNCYNISGGFEGPHEEERHRGRDRKSTRLNSSHANISYAVFCLKKKKKKPTQ